MFRARVARCLVVFFVLGVGLVTSVWAYPPRTQQPPHNESPLGAVDEDQPGFRPEIQGGDDGDPSRVELVLGVAPSSHQVPVAKVDPLTAKGVAGLMLDDGSVEDNVGVLQGEGGPSVQFLWLNRFTPAVDQFPFRLERIEVFFDAGGDGAKAGDDIDLVVYQDNDGDPANGASWLATYPVKVQVADGSSWSVYNLSPPVTVSGSGDILIGVVNRFVETGVTPATYPAALDKNASNGRSWIGWWSGADPPSPAVLPPDGTFSLVDGLGAPGNWMIRGFGEVSIVSGFETFIPQLAGTVPLGDGYEPNNDWLEAFGPLVSGRSYEGLPNDPEDYYFFDLASQAEVTVNVTDYAPTSSFGTVMLYGPVVGQELGNLVDYYGQSGHTVMSLGPHTLQAGKYYVRVSTVEGHYSNTHLYSLTVSFNTVGCPPGTLVPNDPGFAQQWGMSKINGPRAWFCGFQGAGDVVVAVIDSGVDLDHPEFTGKLVPGWDWANGDGSPDDDHGHGSHVAGIVGAIGDNGGGVAGVAWETSIMPLKTLDAQGSGFISWSAEAVVWAADHGADVINMSLGSTYNSPTLQDAVNYAHGKGVLVVASAGNCGDANYWLNGCDREDEPNYPGANDHVIAVASTTKTDTQSSFSTQGSYVDVAAPGSSIYSSLKDDLYGSMSGTSQAAPHVAGLAALVKAAYPDHSPDQIATLIQSSAVDLGSAGRDDQFGWGRIDAAGALAANAVTAASVDRSATEVVPVVHVTREDHAEMAPGKVLTRFSSGSSLQGAAGVLKGLGIYAQISSAVPHIDVLVLEVPVGAEWDVIESLRKSPHVVFAEPDLIVRAY